MCEVAEAIPRSRVQALAGLKVFLILERGDSRQNRRRFGTKFFDKPSGRSFRALATNYDEVYRDSRNALGVPTKEFVQFFEFYEKQRAQVLDLGCGQGRDALFIARLGHCVTGVDQSPAGIRDLLEDASSEGLEIDGVIADICTYTPNRTYDAVVIDRTLHMLAAADRMEVLRRLLAHLSDNAVVLIADERSNLPAFQEVFHASDYRWSPLLSKRGFLFLRREGAETRRTSGGLE